MHAHDRTLLAQLGFADPDKRSPKHDIACQFLALPENAKAVASLFVPSGQEPISETSGVPGFPDMGSQREGVRESALGRLNQVRTEIPVSKGEGKYKTTVGFIDVGIFASLAVKEDYRWRSKHFANNYGEWSDMKAQELSVPFLVFVEVKIVRVSAGDLLRQINLYRQFPPKSHKPHWCAATAYDITDAELKQLKAEHVSHIRLGNKFERFVAAQQSEQAEKGRPNLEL